jgi:hypothetical protein
MYDSSKVIAGLIIFLVLATSPFWLNFGSTTAAPELEYPEGIEQCVEDTDWMRANHMQLLKEWNSAIPNHGPERLMELAQDDNWNGDLTLSCLTCHTKKENFCDRCHSYAGVDLDRYCWQCHTNP